LASSRRGHIKEKRKPYEQSKKKKQRKNVEGRPTGGGGKQRRVFGGSRSYWVGGKKLG